MFRHITLVNDSDGSPDDAHVYDVGSQRLFDALTYKYGDVDWIRGFLNWNTVSAEVGTSIGPLLHMSRARFSRNHFNYFNFDNFASADKIIDGVQILKHLKEAGIDAEPSTYMPDMPFETFLKCIPLWECPFDKLRRYRGVELTDGIYLKEIKHALAMVGKQHFDDVHVYEDLGEPEKSADAVDPLEA